MGSLNGDVIVMRNGRSTSQVSVYNYPEHLNPFYEDDQHKRLRFWKISKRDKEGRRNSFSIGNLKDMWSFKSFRMKKKSSTLGINKTSESPPTLRRDYVLDNSWNTFDHRLRGTNTSSINGDSFQRNATYRSSLQTLQTNNGRIGLNRNDGYRSTIQVARSNPRNLPHQQQQKQQTTGVSQNRRYVYGGSVTPQPLRNSNVGRGSYEYDCDNDIIRRSSQSSLVSSNPFESDNEDENENEDINSSAIRSVNGGSTTTLTSRTPRKKRRAPAPPTPIHGRSNGTYPPPAITIESSRNSGEEELCIKEDIDIANLTAEIESFVKTKSNDDVETIGKKNVEIPATTNSTEALSNNLEKVEIKTNPTATTTAKTTTSNQDVEEDKEKNKSFSTTKVTSDISCATVSTNISTKEETKYAPKSNGQVTTEIITITTTADATKPLKKQTNSAKVTNEMIMKTNESKEIKSNGAIPKKPNNSIESSSVDQQQTQQQTQSTSVEADLYIKERNKEEIPPIPLKRQTKAETEVGHVECIHVHVESPRATPRTDHANGVSSFKTMESVETTETITNKTPFILTSPPTQRKKAQLEDETVKVVDSSTGNAQIIELNITEQRINNRPEIIVKPTLSPKPPTEANGRVHAFAEIHKPIRNKITNNQNGHVHRPSRDESIPPPPIVPLQKATDEEKKIINTAPTQIVTENVKIEEIENVKSTETQAIDNFKIEESLTPSDVSDVILRTDEEKEHKETKVTSISSKVNNNEMLRRDMIDNFDFDLTYRSQPSNQIEWKRSTLAPLETNIPPEKRKSVKDIIESINRSQRLLNAAANKDFTIAATTSTDSTQIASETNNNFNGSPKNSNEAGETAEAASSNCNNEYSEAQKLDNNDIFQKCKVKKEVYDYRESSPISSNLDWNPVPKPKRTKPSQE